MTVKVHNLYSEATRDFSGDEAQVLAQLHKAFDWTQNTSTVADAVKRLNGAQAYTAALQP